MAGGSHVAFLCVHLKLFKNGLYAHPEKVEITEEEEKSQNSRRVIFRSFQQ